MRDKLLCIRVDAFHCVLSPATCSPIHQQYHRGLRNRAPTNPPTLSWVLGLPFVLSSTQIPPATASTNHTRHGQVYRKIKKRQRDRAGDAQPEADGELGEAAARKRAEERMSLRHKVRKSQVRIVERADFSTWRTPVARAGKSAQRRLPHQKSQLELVVQEGRLRL